MPNINANGIQIEYDTFGNIQIYRVQDDKVQGAIENKIS